LCDLLAVAVDDMRQGGDPRLPLELALVKVTRPGADLSSESLAYRLELLERRGHSGPDQGTIPETITEAVPEASGSGGPAPPPLELQQLQEAWQRSVITAVEQRSIPAGSMLREAHPVALVDDRLTVEFVGEADFHRKLAEDPKNAAILRDALYEVTGRRLTLEFTLGERSQHVDEPEEKQIGEEELVALLKETFDAREVDE
jgi:hypothetical protein